MITGSEIVIHTLGFSDIHDLTTDIEAAVIEAGVKEGLVNVFAVGSTASITLWLGTATSRMSSLPRKTCSGLCTINFCGRGMPGRYLLFSRALQMSRACLSVRAIRVVGRVSA